MKMPFVVYEGEKPYLFISYSHQDAETVESVLRELSGHGFRFWYDEGISPGSEWPEDVARHLMNAGVVVAFISPQFIQSENCRREIHFALMKKKQLLTVTLERTEMPLGMEMQLSSHQSILRYNYTDWQSFMEKILRSPILQPCGGDADVSSAPAAQTEKEGGSPSSSGSFDFAKDARLQAVYMEAAEYMLKGEYSKEQQALEKGLSIDSENPKLLLKLGRCYRMQGIYQKAMECYIKAISADPMNPTAYLNIGVLYVSLNDYNKGKIYFEKAVAIIQENPSSATPNDIATLYANYSYCIGRLGDLENAKKYLKLASQKGYKQENLEYLCKLLNLDPAAL